MMRTKHKMDDTHVQGRLKKQKPGIDEAPLPNHITIKNNTLLYHFNETAHATKFLNIIQNNLSAELSNELPTSVYTRCDHGKNQKHCRTVSIKPDQFNYLFAEKKAYQEMCDIHAALTAYNMHITRVHLVGMNAKLANQVALLMDEEDGCHFYEWIFGKDKENERCSDLASFLIPLLDSEIINRIALENDEWIFLLPNDIKSFIYANLTAETCNNIGANIERMYILITEINDEIILEFFKKLNRNICDKLALTPTKSGECILDLIADYCNNIEILHCFISQLTPATCNQLQYQSLITFRRYADAKTYKLFMGKSKPELQIDQTFHRDITNPAASTRKLLQSLAILAKHPRELESISNQDSHLMRLNLWDGGRSKDSWSKITRKIVIAIPAPSEKKKDHSLSFELDKVKDTVKFRPISMNTIEKDEWNYLRTQGRTVLLTNARGEILAIKIQKKMEEKEDLIKEFSTTLYLKNNANKFDLKSRLPTPIDLVSIYGFSLWMIAKMGDTDEAVNLRKMIGTLDVYNAYIYIINPKQCNYFTYLHDPILSDNNFNKANRDAVHDLFVLLQHGVVFSQLADIFHNSERTKVRADKGRYIVLVNLLNNWDLGSGRITDWQESVRYPNVRASGIADLGDRISIEELYKQSKFVQEFYQTTRDDYGDKTGNLLVANVMAEYQYILFLIAGRRAYALTQKANNEHRSSGYIKKIWAKVATQIVDNCAQAISILTKVPEKQVKVSLLSIVDVKRLAIQMQYWMTDEYIQDVANDNVRDGVYGSSTTVSVNKNKFRKNTFNLKQGFSIDGIHSDLGPVNGQEPIKEANKLFYWMVTQIFSEYEKFRHTLKELHEIKSEKNFKKSEKLRHQSFFYLPEKNYHALQYALCHERLKQTLSDDKRVALLKEAKQHKEDHAAAVIQNAWRNRTPSLKK